MQVLARDEDQHSYYACGFECGDCPLDQRPTRSCVLVFASNSKVIEKSAAPIMACKDRSDERTFRRSNEAQARVPSKIAGQFLHAIPFGEFDAIRLRPQLARGGKIGFGHGTELNEQRHERDSNCST